MQDILWIVFMVAVGAVGLVLIIWLVQLVRYLTRRKKPALTSGRNRHKVSPLRLRFFEAFSSILHFLFLSSLAQCKITLT